MLVLHISFLGQYVTHGDSLIDWLIDVTGHRCVCACMRSCVREGACVRGCVRACVTFT